MELARVIAASVSGFRKAFRLCVAAGVLIVAGAPFVACEAPSYAETIRIVAEPVNVAGLFARVEYLRDGELTNSVHLIDGNGDGIVDGKSGPSEQGLWPAGWEWFDAMYEDVVVGQTPLDFDGQKVVVRAESTYEFVVGEYECRAAS